MAKFDTSMLPPRPEPRRVRDLAIGQTRFVSESDLKSLRDGTGLISTRAHVRSCRSFLYPVSVTRTRTGWKVEVPHGFRIWSTRSTRPSDHDEINEVVLGNPKPEPGPTDYAEGVVTLIRLISQ